MAGLIPQAFIDDLLDRVDIVDVVDSRVKLKKTGKNYSACCPFHDEKTPSFTVSPDKQFYYCFGCGASGNALGFVIDHDRLSFPDAVEQLARLAGVSVPREVSQDNPADRLRKQLYEILEKADKFYQQQLRQHPQRGQAVSYLRQRGLSGEIARDFGIGYAPAGWDNLLRQLGTDDHSRKLLLEAGLTIEKPEDGRRYDRFRERIMFPIRDVRGRIIGFGGRVLGDEKPKYLNSPETAVFHKGKELYGLYEARQAHRELPRLLVVEGYMDVVALAQFDIRYACATLGTACGEDHLTSAFRHTQEIVFCFDGDRAGRQAARRALENSLPAISDGRHIKFLFLPDGEDPDTLVRQIGKAKFEQLIEHSVPLEDFLFDACAEDLNISTMDGRATLSKRAAPMINRMPSGVFRELMYSNLATRTGLPKDVLMELINSDQPAPQPSEASHSADTHQPSTSVHTPPPQYSEPQHREPQYRPPKPQTPQSTAAPAPASAQRPGPPATPPHPGQQQAASHLITLLLQQPALAAQVTDIDLLRASGNADLNLLAGLAELLQQRPHYSLNRILGHWQASRPAAESARLAQLAFSELLLDVGKRPTFDLGNEFADSLRRLNQQLHRQNDQQLLAKLQAKGLTNLSAEEKQQYLEALSKRHRPA